ncbi:unnamed protein product [Orchesella dallaii]|uniref:Uncharacterized protein n=1 Tax=Orchesella dallaii TaxID=48710 RepID=A0ABP1PWS6_9HEXA
MANPPPHLEDDSDASSVIYSFTESSQHSAYDDRVKENSQAAEEYEELMAEDYIDDLSPPPTPGVRPKRRKQNESVAGPSKIVRKRVERRSSSTSSSINGLDFTTSYTELIETCNSLQMDQGVHQNFQKVMTENIERGKKLFERLARDAEPFTQEFDLTGRRQEKIGQRRRGLRSQTDTS